ncbi:MAG: PHP domain-containing protein, partial [Bacteroidetes bacterium]
MYLNCHSYFSLRYGTLSPAALVEAAQQRGVEALALTDVNNTSGALEFYRLCRGAGIRPLLGIDFRTEGGERRYVGLARNLEGWAELNELLTRCSLENKPLPPLAPPLQYAYVVYPRLVKPIERFAEHELLGIRPEHVHGLFSSEVRRFPEKLVVLSPVTFLDEAGYALHRILRAIDLNTLLAKLPREGVARKTELFHPPQVLRDFYKTYPKILRNTERIVADCSIDFETGLQLNRQTFTGSKGGDYHLLEKLAVEGCRRRYGPRDKRALERVQRELRVIRQQDFCAYFLIAWDVVRYAQNAGYHHVGRGSGANSIVAFCLGITDVDPLELDLYFERFINPHRASPPDFDIDFSWDERDDVVDYIFKRYGTEHTALLATYNTFKGRSIVRELGKVFGLPKAEIDLLSEAPERYAPEAGPLPRALRRRPGA